jgi:lactate permease
VSANPATWLLALSPIIAVLILMVGLRWGGSRAGPVGWLVALLAALFFFGATPTVILYSQVRAAFLSLYVLYIIWMALLLYHVVNEAGAIEVIGDTVSRLTRDRVLQLLILSWAFSSFLQGVAGFGVPIAVVAPLLIGMGFSPVVSVAAVAIGHSWSVTFGDIASSFQALIAASGLEGQALAPWSACFLGLACFGCGMGAVHVYLGTRGLRRAAVAVVLMGAAMALTQYWLAVSGLWNVAGFMAGLAGLAAGAVAGRLPIYRQGDGEPLEIQRSQGRQERPAPLMAITPYLILVLFVTAAELVEPIHHALNQVAITVYLPRVSTALGWVTQAGPARSISIFGHAGALLGYTCLLGYLIFRLGGYYQPGTLGRMWKGTLSSAVPSTIGIASMVGMAMIMDHSGMVHLLARGISEGVGSTFPVFSPLIGTLGAFMTGSNTNSNVVFAPLQKTTAELIGISSLVVLGAQTTGGALGSMLAPAKIIVGCSTAGLAGREGQVLRKTLPYGMLIAGCIGLVAWLFLSYS